MSNLFKYNTVQCDLDKKVIDYNDLIAEKLSKFKEREEDVAPSEEELSEDGFKVGIAAREVAVTLEAEEEIEIAEPEITPEELLEEAKREAEEILENARREAEEQKREVYDKAYQEANQAGYDEGYKQASDELQKKQEELEKQKTQLLHEYQEQLNEMEPKIVDAIVTVVQSVFKIKFEDNRNMILHLVKIALGQIQNSKSFMLKVSKSDYPFILKYKEVLDKSIIGEAEINIVEDNSLLKNQCLIETDGGVFDCSLDVQLDNLTKMLRILSRS